MANADQYRSPDKNLAAVCGLFCPGCRIFLDTIEDPEKLRFFADRYGCSVEEAKCQGCRAEKRCFYCDNCTFVKCAAEKGIEFCGDCPGYPCKDLAEFQFAMPHRIELWTSQERIKEVGYEKWYTEMVERYSCPQCGTLNSAYDLSCRKCGATPSCTYVSQHKDAIEEFMANRK